jgi:hypothetical protein
VAAVISDAINGLRSSINVSHAAAASLAASRDPVTQQGLGGLAVLRLTLAAAVDMRVLP